MTHEKLLTEIINDFNELNGHNSIIKIEGGYTANCGFKLIVKIPNYTDLVSAPNINNIKTLSPSNKRFIREMAFERMISMMINNFISIKLNQK